jgi:hypothetical protein
MLGTPNGGSFVIPRLLLGRERLMRQIALLDLKHTQRQLLDIVSRYPGLLEMLPSVGNYEFFSDKKWQELFKQMASRKTLGSCLILSGSAPPGTSAELWMRLSLRLAGCCMSQARPLQHPLR